MNDLYRKKLHELLDKIINENQPIGILDCCDLLEDGIERRHFRLSLHQDIERSYYYDR